MSSLVLDLQSEIYSDKPLSIIIRKAHVIARKLALLKFDEWLDKELNGYPTIDVPPFRNNPNQNSILSHVFYAWDYFGLILPFKKN